MFKIHNTIAVVLTATAIVLFACQLGCQEDAAEPEAQPVAVETEVQSAPVEVSESIGPRIEFEEKFHNFGVIEDIEVVKHDFVFRNVGDEPLVIHSVKASGRPRYHPNPYATIQPGEQSTIPVSFNARGRSGHQAKSTRVESNDHTNRIVNLRISADIFALVSVEPKVFRFDQVVAGQSKAIVGTVRIRGEESKVTGVEVDGTFASAKVIGVKSITILDVQSTETTIEVTVHEDAALGWLDRNVIIHTDHPARPMVKAPLWANVLGDIEIQPAKLPLGVVRSGAEFQRELRLISRTGESFKITGIRIETDADDLDLRCEPQVDPAEPAQPIIRVIVKGTGPEQIGILKGDIVIETSGDNRPINVPFHCVVRPSK